MSTVVTIRPAEVADVPGIVELGAAVIPATYAPIDPALADHQLRTWWSAETLEERVLRLPHWIAEAPDGTVLGVADLGRYEGRAVLWKLYVRPDSQRKGIGQALLAEVVAAAAGEDLWLDAFAANDRAIAFYRAQGFEPVPDAETPTVVGNAMVRMRRRS